MPNYYRSYNARIQSYKSNNKFKLGKKVLLNCFEMSHVIAVGFDSSLSVLNYCLASMSLRTCSIFLKRVVSVLGDSCLCRIFFYLRI